MGCAASAEAYEPPTTGSTEEYGMVCLVEKGSPNQLRLDHAHSLRSGTGACPLTLASHPGFAIVPRYDHPRAADEWRYIEIGLGPAGMAMVCQQRGEHIVRIHDERVMDIAHWKYEVGNTLNILRSARSHPAHTNVGGGGRSFTVNQDGTVSPKFAPHLTLGVTPPDCTLVSRGAMGTLHEMVTLAPEVARALRSGQVAPLVLASPPGCAIVPKTDTPRRIDEWHIAYQHLGIGPAHAAMPVRLEGPFLLSAHPLSRDFILDVPFGKLNVHCTGEHGPLPIAAINVERGTNKEHGNAARLFQINDDNTISPQKAPHLVFGIRGALLPQMGGAGPPPTVVATPFHIL